MEWTLNSDETTMETNERLLENDGKATNFKGLQIEMMHSLIVVASSE